MAGSGHIRFKQALARCAAVATCLAFALLPLDVLLGSAVPRAYLLWTALAALFLAVAAYAMLASAICARCGQTFIGNTVPDSDGPPPEPFATQCRYCGNPR